MEYLNGDLFEYALLCGMTYEQYWYADPNLLVNYSNVYIKKADDKMNWIDILSHRIGMYFAEALETTPIIPLGVINSKQIKKILKDHKYPQKPHLIDKKEKDLNIIDVEVVKPSNEQREAYKKRLAELRNKKSG